MSNPPSPQNLAVFATSLGWMALVGRGNVLLRLTFGHASAREAVEAAIEALEPDLLELARPGDWNPPLVERLKAYACGDAVDFDDVEVDPGPISPFRRRVLRCCRRIPYGSTLTYGQLAAKAGSRRAARAVGSCMATNRIPLIIPCHRVVSAGGRIGGFSALGGARTKQRLLTMEARAAENNVRQQR